MNGEGNKKEVQDWQRELSLLCFIMDGSSLLTLSDPQFCASSLIIHHLIHLIHLISQHESVITGTHYSSHTPRGLDPKKLLPRAILQNLRHPERLEE